MEPLKKSGTGKVNSTSPEVKSAAARDNNDDNEFATPGLKAKFTVDSKPSVSTAGVIPKDQPAGGSADKADSSQEGRASMLERKLNSRIDELASLVERAGEKIQRLGEALCRIGDQVEHMPERKFGMKKSKRASTEAQKSESRLN